MNVSSVISLPVYWEMTNSEKIALFSLLSEIKPSISVEIGTKERGSLQLISHFSKKVYSIDIDPAVSQLKNKFNNTEFLIGNSLDILPELIDELERKGEYPDFIFIDGDHSREGVKKDIVHALKTTIKKPLHILIHDSFNPECRAGIMDVDYSLNSNVKKIDIDFVHGLYSPTKHTKGEMWGGFCLITLDNDQSTSILKQKKSSDYSFQSSYQFSIHRLFKPKNFKDRIKSFVFRKLFM